MSTPIVRRRKKPVVVDTIQWLGDNEADVQAFTGSDNFWALDPEDRENSDDPAATATVYDRLHSTWVLVYTGQHIVRGVKAEYYPIAEDVLAETYEDADTPLHAACRTQFLNEAADVAASCVALYEGSDEAAAAAGAMEGLADRFRRMAGEKGAAETAVGPGFFQPGRTYAHGDYRFICEYLAIHPVSGRRSAWGWFGKNGAWRHQNFSERQFQIREWTDVTEAGGDRG